MALSDEDKALWARVTKGVTPLEGDKPALPAPTSAIESFPKHIAATPRSKPFRPVIDLHGLVLHDAYQATMSHILTASQLGRYRYVIVITGLSGDIHTEFPRWVNGHPKVKSINALRGGGAWEVWLKRRDT